MFSGKEERAEFSNRLISVLIGLGWPKASPKRLMQQFNERAGNSAVSAHAARKWLIGEAIPAQERLSILAAWLEVEPDWLRFGASESAKYERLIPTSNLILLRDVARLDPANKRLVQGMVALLIKANARQAENDSGAEIPNNYSGNLPRPGAMAKVSADVSGKPGRPEIGHGEPA